MNLKEYVDLRLQSERDKQIWTDKDMFKSFIFGVFLGIIIGLVL